MARHIADAQTEDRHLALAAKTDKAPPRAVSVPLDHRGGEKRNLSYKCFIKNNSKSKSKYKSSYSSFILHRIISHF